MTLKSLVLLVEGEGDVQAAPELVKRLLSQRRAYDTLTLDRHPLRIGEYGKISKDGFAKWRRFLQVATKRPNLGGCLLILDGDSRATVAGQRFCAERAAQLLASEARNVGGGTLFSVAVVFACTEFESWLIAGAPSLAGKSFSDGRKLLDALPDIPVGLETAPRDAKGWFRTALKMGYKPAIDQAELTRLVDLDMVRQRGMRSFRRLEHAVEELVGAIRCGQHRVTPAAG